MLLSTLIKYLLALHPRFLAQNDKKIPQDNDYNPPFKSGKDSTHKYIATALEALLATFYLDHRHNFGLVVEVVEDWKRLIDRSLQRSCQQ